MKKMIHRQMTVLTVIMFIGMPFLTAQNSAASLLQNQLATTILKFLDAVNSGNRDSVTMFTHLYLSRDFATIGSTTWSEQQYITITATAFMMQRCEKQQCEDTAAEGAIPVSAPKGKWCGIKIIM